MRPPDKIDGKFSARQKTASGTYLHPDELDASAEDVESGTYTRSQLRERDSFDSIISSGSIGFGVCTPRRMKLLMGEEDRRKYEIAQQMQTQASEVGNMQAVQSGRELSDSPLRRANYLASTNARHLHDQGQYGRVSQGEPNEGSNIGSTDDVAGPTQERGQSRLGENMSFASRMARGLKQSR